MSATASRKASRWSKSRPPSLSCRSPNNAPHPVRLGRGWASMMTTMIWTVRAPFAGQIKERSVTQGQYLKVQTPVMVIVNIDPLRVRLKVPEKLAAWVHEGQEVTIAVEAYANRTFKGKVTRINPSVDQQTRAFEVEALIENHDN